MQGTKLCRYRVPPYGVAVARWPQPKSSESKQWSPRCYAVVRVKKLEESKGGADVRLSQQCRPSNYWTLLYMKSSTTIISLAGCHVIRCSLYNGGLVTR